jgi:glutamate-1-semialdehyde 2,1-aminomutase
MRSVFHLPPAPMSRVWPSTTSRPSSGRVAEAGGDLAAIVIEPVVERLPSREWLDAARRLCDAQGAVLVFDEIKTGFRLRPGGYQDYGKFEPDIAAFGKAMANGFPISAVVGRAAIMEAATKTWISSTLASEAMSLAAVAGVLEWHDSCRGVRYAVAHR